MNWSVITVPRNDLWSTLEAIRLRGGTVTATKLAGSDVAITCVMGEGRSFGRLGHLGRSGVERCGSRSHLSEMSS